VLVPHDGSLGEAQAAEHAVADGLVHQHHVARLHHGRDDGRHRARAVRVEHRLVHAQEGGDLHPHAQRRVRIGVGVEGSRALPPARTAQGVVSTTSMPRNEPILLWVSALRVRCPALRVSGGSHAPAAPA
jgi:hypothetical protein